MALTRRTDRSRSWVATATSTTRPRSMCRTEVMERSLRMAIVRRSTGAPSATVDAMPISACNGFDRMKFGLASRCSRSTTRPSTASEVSTLIWLSTISRPASPARPLPPTSLATACSPLGSIISRAEAVYSAGTSICQAKARATSARGTASTVFQRASTTRHASRNASIHGCAAFAKSLPTSTIAGGLR